jgi:CarboxypepD_reg-like domain/Tetratricopeptide repeat
MLRSYLVFWRIAALLILAAVFLPPTIANPTGSLSGVVYAEAGHQRIRLATVWLCDDRGNDLQQTIASDSGDFAFLNVTGEFTLKVSAPGYETAEVRVEVGYGDVRGVSIFLKASKSPVAAASEGSTISAHELSMPKSARDLVTAGKKKLYAEKNPTGALHDFESAVSKAPSYYEAYYLLGMTYLALQNPEQTEQNLQRSVDLSDQSYPNAVLALALLWLGRNDATRGEPMLRRGLELNPNSWVGFVELGKLELYRDHIEPALQAAEKARSLAPTQPKVYKLLSWIHLKQKNYSAALVDLDSYIRLDPDSLEGLRAKEVRAETEKRLADSQKQAP